MFNLVATMSGEKEIRGVKCLSFSVNMPDNLRKGVRVLEYKYVEYDQIDFDKIATKPATKSLYIEKLFADGALVFDGAVDA